MIYLQKLLPTLFFPLTLISFCLILSLWRKKSGFIIIALGLIAITSTPIASKTFLRAIEGQATKSTPTDIAFSDAVVVLGGFIGRVQTTNGVELEWGNASRFFAGIELMKENKAPYLIFTNEKLPWMPDTVPVGTFLSNYAELLGVNPKKILITRDVQNTEEESKAVRLLGGQYHLHRIILVTSAFHMQRAKQLFEKEGFIVMPYPVHFSGNADNINLLDFIPNAHSMMITEGAIKELMARVYYRIKASI